MHGMGLLCLGQQQAAHSPASLLSQVATLARLEICVSAPEPSPCHDEFARDDPGERGSRG
jgi:hypothetical protein